MSTPEMISSIKKPAKTFSLGGLTLPRVLPQLVMLAIVLVANVIISPQFFDIQIRDGRLFGSIVDVFNRGAPVMILALGMTLVIATGGIDLSVGAVIAIAGATAATLVENGFPLWQVLSVSLMVGLACGLWNGVLVSFLRIQPFVATLILMVAGRGIAQLITEGRIVTFTDPNLIAIGSGTFMSIPMPVIIAFAMTVFALVLFRATALGMMVEATGINRLSSTYAGINTRLILTTVYLWGGFCASVSGLIIAADIRGADANNAGLWMELDAILAVVIGGTSLLGGRFSLLMSIVGALIIQSMNTGILLSGFKPEFNLIVKAIVVLAVLFVQSPTVKNFKLNRLPKGGMP